MRDSHALISTAQLSSILGRPSLRIYSIGTMMWATRFWWMLKSLGFDGATVLDGGFDKWTAEGRPTESGPVRGYPPTTAPWESGPRILRCRSRPTDLRRRA
jgi:3-mercaptopyruvate sulfurtransferase SseA